MNNETETPPKPAPGDVAGKSLAYALDLIENIIAGRTPQRCVVPNLRTAAISIRTRTEQALTPSPDSPSLLQEAVEALGDIAAERARQIDVEGWTPEHDDRHGDGAMARAAACYAAPRAVTFHHVLEDRRSPPVVAGQAFLVWPWDFKWWKPKSERENLVRAGALIVAEIERLDRLRAATPAQQREEG